MCVTGKRLKCTLTSGREDNMEQVSGSRLVLDEGTRIPSLIRVIFAFLVVAYAWNWSVVRVERAVVSMLELQWQGGGRPGCESVVTSPTVFRHGQPCVLAGR